MKNHPKLDLHLVFFLFFAFIILQSTFLVRYSICTASVPRVISYQARLSDDSGEPLEGTYNVTFSIYTEPTGGSPLWMETHTVELDSTGIYDIMLGTITPFPAELDFSEQYWLGITINGGAELSPRYQLSSSPYTFHAIYADSVDTSRFAYYAEEAIYAYSASEALNAVLASFSDTASFSYSSNSEYFLSINTVREITKSIIATIIMTCPLFNISFFRMILIKVEIKKHIVENTINVNT